MVAFAHHPLYIYGINDGGAYLYCRCVLMSLSRNKFYLISLILGLILIYIFTLEAFSSWRISGDMNKGHEKLSCVECHQPAKGTTRQQIQSNVKYWLGFITEATPFGYITPDNKDCLSCHEREDDNHPVYRFNEPKFSKARKAIHPEHCSSCHQEHNGVRVTSKPTNCKHCHKDLRLKEDKISPAHQTLIKDKNWVSCLGCHDFHGNHKRETPTKKENMIVEDTLKAYFLGGKNPYGDRKITTTKETRYED